MNQDEKKNKKRKNHDKQQEQNNKKNNKSLIIVVIIIGMLLMGVGIYLLNNSDDDENTLSYTELIKEISYSNVEKIEMTSGSTEIEVKMVNDEELKTVLIPNTESFIELVQTKVEEGNDIELIQNSQSILTTLPYTILSLLPTVIMVVLLVVIVKMQGLRRKRKNI